MTYLFTFYFLYIWSFKKTINIDRFILLIYSSSYGLNIGLLELLELWLNLDFYFILNFPIRESVAVVVVIVW